MFAIGLKRRDFKVILNGEGMITRMKNIPLSPALPLKGEMGKNY